MRDAAEDSDMQLGCAIGAALALVLFFALSDLLAESWAFGGAAGAGVAATAS